MTAALNLNGNVWGDYVCHCGERHGIGCLLLTPRDQRRASRLLTIAGIHADVAPGHVSLVTTASAVRRVEDREPVIAASCSDCGRLMQMLAYLVEFIERHDRDALVCSICTSRKAAA